MVYTHDAVLSPLSVLQDVQYRSKQRLYVCVNVRVGMCVCVCLVSQEPALWLTPATTCTAEVPNVMPSMGFQLRFSQNYASRHNQQNSCVSLPVGFSSRSFKRGRRPPHCVAKRCFLWFTLVFLHHHKDVFVATPGLIFLILRLNITKS